MDLIPIADPRAAYLAHRSELDAAIRSVLEGPAYILGEQVERFEEAFAAYVGVAHGVGVNNGTDAIHLALRALGIGAGDEVITVSQTAVATVAAIRMSGADPVLADVDALTCTLDPEAVLPLITPRTKAVIAVHLYGHPADLSRLSALCEARDLRLIEDCAQAHGALHGDRMVGSFGDVSTFSFYPTKNLGAIGDAGMVLTKDAELALKVRRLRQYGWDTPQYSLVEGWNSRLDPLQAAILAVKLRHLEESNDRRRALAARYLAELADLPVQLPLAKARMRHVYHLFVVRTADLATREALLAHLLAAGIRAAVHYPTPVHLQPAYRGVLRTGPMAVTEQLAGTVLSLPLHPALTDEQQDRVINAMRTFFRPRS
ncbi:MAG TPA: DegT/DnrJ/EryC1/StrS family aminotransferase [Flavobacteriales bacterium]|nr:DegT/DnrJ/EryC1/StrS family aminotransferase [Flavobacteriales bacterium]